MCGIAAIAGSGWTKADLDAMVRSQRHRGPDATGSHLSPSGAAGLAHNRLSIIDLSDAGRQPMCSPDGRLWLVFNGEIYNYVELRRELSGYPFRSNTDSEVILAAYQRWGAACLDHLIGMFAFAFGTSASSACLPHATALASSRFTITRVRRGRSSSRARSRRCMRPAFHTSRIRSPGQHI